MKGPSGRSEIMLFRNVHGDPKPIQGKPRFSLFSIFQIFDFNRNSNKNETKDEKADVPMFIPHSLLAGRRSEHSFKVLHSIATNEILIHST